MNDALHICKFDTETDGLLPELTKLHCLVINSSKYGKISCAHDARYTSIERGLEILAEADILVGHNIIGFDLLAILKVYPNWKAKPGCKVIDTIVLARMLFPDIHKQRGINNHKLMPFEKRLHKLEVWGKRLGEFKGDYSAECKKAGIDPWAVWTVKMQLYCEQDVVVTDKLFAFLMARKPTTESMDIEQEFAKVILRQEIRGCAFDIKAAHHLTSILTQREAQLEADLIAVYGEWWQPAKNAKTLGWAEAKAKASVYRDSEEDEDDYDEITEEEARQRLKAEAEFADAVVPDRSSKRYLRGLGLPDVTIPRYSPKTGKRLKDYAGPPIEYITKGCSYTPVKRVQFNPSSRQHIRRVLIQRHGWVPTKWTKPSKQFKKGQPVVDDAVLRGLAAKIPECALLADYFVVLKRLGQISAGQKAWLKLAVLHADGQYRIHGRVNTCGAYTSRCTHSNPNLAQVPKSSSEYGPECRALFIPGIGYVMVGWDAAALELRMLAHYVAPYDGGEYAKIVSTSDPHAWLRDLIGVDLMAGEWWKVLDPHTGQPVPKEKAGRDNSKTVMYAEIFGAGFEKVGSIIMPSASVKDQIELGHEVKEKMGNRFEAKARLQTFIENYVEANGVIKALDGRLLPVRKAHASLNCLLQSGGAIAMKKATILNATEIFPDARFVDQIDYAKVLDVHDEGQFEVKPEVLEAFKLECIKGLPLAGEILKVRCPMRAEASSGTNWAETH